MDFSRTSDCRSLYLTDYEEQLVSKALQACIKSERFLEPIILNAGNRRYHTKIGLIEETLWSRSAGAFIGLGQIAYIEGDTQKAKSLFERSAELYQRKDKAHVNYFLGSLYENGVLGQDPQQPDLEKAYEHFVIAYHAEPRPAIAKRIVNLYQNGFAAEEDHEAYEYYEAWEQLAFSPCCIYSPEKC